jgi:hypothetical protein
MDKNVSYFLRNPAQNLGEPSHDGRLDRLPPEDSSPMKSLI